MTTVQEFFRTEAEDCLRRLDALLDGAVADGVDAPELLRLTRLLRGSAQMAREDDIAALARAFESVARAVVSNVVAWDEELAARARETVAELRALVEAEAGQERAERAARAVRALDRWRPSPAETPTEPSPAAARAVAEEFQDFAAREVAGIGAEMDRCLPILEREPRNREPLKAILRRQRALLGAARIDELPPVAEALRAIDRICRLIARQDAPVEGDWLELFRTARRVLAESVEGLVAGTPPTETPSLESLRAIRDGLLDRYGVLQEPLRPQVQAGVEPPKNVGDFFRHEAGVLLTRIERMASDLDRATGDRQTVLRRELQAAITALRDTALGLGFGRTARMAETALARVGGITASEVLDLLPSLRETVETDQPVSVSVARGEEEASRAEAGVAASPEAPGVAAGPDGTTGVAVTADGGSGAAASHEGAPGVATSHDGASASGHGAGGETEREVVPIATLVYRGAALVQRAEELRPILERALAGNDEALEALSELYDLIRQGSL